RTPHRAAGPLPDQLRAVPGSLCRHLITARLIVYDTLAPESANQTCPGAQGHVSRAILICLSQRRNLCKERGLLLVEHGHIRLNVTGRGKARAVGKLTIASEHHLPHESAILPLHVPPDQVPDVCTWGFIEPGWPNHP